ncbi:MAG TPA: peptidyl-prolyl cis-trans isomerase [Spirochaetales bacterium]|nr:peptidyl-prolyl cis-trans isomerase [Spirochaetales bacterium]
MIKRMLTLFLLVSSLALVGAQTAIDKPAATIKLIRQEVISVRQLKADVEKLQKVTNTTWTPDQIRIVLDNRINSMLFLQYCEREKISVSDTEVNNALAQMKASLGANATDADLEKALQSSGVFVEPKTYVKQRLLFENYIKLRRANDLKAAMVQPTADEILKAYDLAKASLVQPDTMRVSVLYVDTRGSSDADSKKAKALLDSVAAALKTNPSKFDEYVLRAGDAAGYKAIPSLYIEKTSQNRSLYGADLFDAIFKLKAGEISGVVQSPTGYRIVRANEFIPQKQLGLSDTIPGNENVTVQQYIAYQLLNDKQAKFLSDAEADLVAKIRKEATVKVFDENLSW